MLTEITQARVPEGTHAASNTAKRITGGHLVARALKAEGIEAIFTLCGGHIIDIYDGCVDAGIRHHRRSARAGRRPRRRRLDAPDRHPRLRRGHRRARHHRHVTAVANAWRAQTPMLVIGGQGPLNA